MVLQRTTIRFHQVQLSKNKSKPQIAILCIIETIFTFYRRCLSSKITLSEMIGYFLSLECLTQLLYIFVASVMENSKCLLKLFSHNAFNNAAQILLSNLDQTDLQQLLRAVEHHLQFQQLSQLIRGRIVVLLCQRNDRTIYYSCFQMIPLMQLKQQRGNLLSATYSNKELKSLLESYSSLVSKGAQIYGEQFAQIKQSILEPTLALPPVRRETIAPNCQTIYQITLAFQKLKFTMEEQNNFALNQKTADYFEECLTFQIEMVYYSVNSLVDDLEHFVELSYRFMVYRNTVLSFHNICPFTDISSTMRLWTSRMSDQYARANQVYLKLLGIKTIQDQKYELFTYEELKQQSYMLDYVESLVDQSVTEDDVAFCGHSKQKFRGLYAKLQSQIVQWVRLNKSEIKATVNIQEVQKTMQNWCQYGLKPSTLSKVLSILNEFVNCTVVDRELCCRDDYFIENCARINGLSLPDRSQVHLQCF